MRAPRCLRGSGLRLGQQKTTEERPGQQETETQLYSKRIKVHGARFRVLVSYPDQASAQIDWLLMTPPPCS